MKAFVISLPAATARREILIPQLEGAGLQFDIVDAVSGAEIASELDRYCRTLYCPRYCCDLTLNEVACCASHGRALRAFLNSREPHALILEDDEVVPQGVAVITDKIVQRPSCGFDILKVGGIGGEVNIGGETRVRRTNKPTMGAHAYVVSRTGAQKLLSRLTPVTVLFDSYLRHVYEHGCIVYETSPHLVGVHDGGVSHIGLRAISPRRLTIGNRLSTFWFNIRHNLMHGFYKLRHGRETEFIC